MAILIPIGRVGVRTASAHAVLQIAHGFRYQAGGLAIKFTHTSSEQLSGDSPIEKVASISNLLHPGWMGVPVQSADGPTGGSLQYAISINLPQNAFEDPNYRYVRQNSVIVQVFVDIRRPTRNPSCLGLGSPRRCATKYTMNVSVTIISCVW
jgi:hypothetical protein